MLDRRPWPTRCQHLYNQCAILMCSGRFHFFPTFNLKTIFERGMHWELVYLFVCLIITNPLTKFHQILIRKLDQENVLGLVDFFLQRNRSFQKNMVSNLAF